jgi:hypothetical protein
LWVTRDGTTAFVVILRAHAAWSLRRPVCLHVKLLAVLPH